MIDEFGNRFQVNHDEESRVVTVGFTFPEPGMAADIVNYASDLFVRRQLEDKIAEANKTLTWMEQRLAQMESDVRTSEAAVESYRADNDLIRDPTARSEEDVAANLTLARNQADAEVAELQSRLRAAQRLRQNPEAVAGMVTVADAGEPAPARARGRPPGSGADDQLRRATSAGCSFYSPKGIVSAQC